MLGRSGELARAVPAGLRQAVLHQQAALIAERDAVPRARLADEGIGRRGHRLRQVLRSPPVRLLFHRPDDGDARVRQLRRDLRRRQHERRQRPFRIHRAAPVKLVPLPPHGDEAGHRIHVPEQHDMAIRIGIAHRADNVPRLVAVCHKAQLAHLRDEVFGEDVFSAGRAGNGEEFFKEFEVVHNKS